METTLICSGLGGQGVMMIGQLLGYAASLDPRSRKICHILSVLRV